MYSVPWNFKDYQGTEKGLLRHAMEGILPDDVLYRKKSPFPKTHDPRYLSLVSESLRRVISSADVPIFALVSKDKLASLLDMDFTWPWYGQLMRRPQTIAYMLQINMWLEEYGVQIV
jgi:asparagine synthase (glutamine-hydrolysing)